MRRLGIPTVVDRMIQQALLQVLQPQIDPTFSESSYGFRPGRSAHQAVEGAREHVRAGYRWSVVDMDLEEFFDRVSHDILMLRLARRVEEKSILLLIRRYLQAGLMEGGVVSQRGEGTPPREGWGSSEEHPFLHFNVCLYHSVEDCIRRGLQVFEGGAGGDHKLARGFEPAETWSAHLYLDRRLDRPVRRHLEEERAERRRALERWRAEAPILKPAASAPTTG